MLTLNKISKSFVVDDKVINAVNDVTLEVDNGEFLTIIGPSGCGKSTLLRIIAGLEKQDLGEIIWKVEPKVSFVFQNFALFPYLTVFENIEFGLKMSGVASDKRHKIVQKLLEEVGLLGFEDKHPKELSGGMKQRVGIARALTLEPNILLLDEPFSALDEFTAGTLRKLLLNIWYQRKITIIMVTHLVTEAVEMSDKIAVLSTRPGTVKTIIENKLKRPRDLRSRETYLLEDELKSLIDIR